MKKYFIMAFTLLALADLSLAKGRCVGNGGTMQGTIVCAPKGFHPLVAAIQISKNADGKTATVGLSKRLPDDCHPPEIHGALFENVTVHVPPAQCGGDCFGTDNLLTLDNGDSVRIHWGNLSPFGNGVYHTGNEAIELDCSRY